MSRLISLEGTLADGNFKDLEQFEILIEISNETMRPMKTIRKTKERRHESKKRERIKLN